MSRNGHKNLLKKEIHSDFVFSFLLQPLMVPSQTPVRSAQVGNSMENEDMLHGMMVKIQIRWSYGGKRVAVEGSWDDWKSKYKDLFKVSSYGMFVSYVFPSVVTWIVFCFRELLPGSGKEFSITKVLPLGIYHFRFIVDGQWRNTPELPLIYDNTGCAYNVLDLKVNLCFSL